MPRAPISFALLAASTLASLPAIASDRIDRQTETAIPRTGNLYGLGIGVLPATSGSDELRTMVLPVFRPAMPTASTSTPCVPGCGWWTPTTAACA
ncbi:hypothetical protein [Zoogloea sp.]|uniref:hypothetical protein n=1 Tax=Zoogloea sp. TaxID=49181 RepID=UPI0025F11CD4|nr:hypothetical protein [Zoogloea sp.]MCK6392293.1 hypothetical protein [Zoogloea sp.]